MRKEKRNVMWRACLDLQNTMDDLLLKRAKVRGQRNREKGTGHRPNTRKKARQSSDG